MTQTMKNPEELMPEENQDKSAYDTITVDNEELRMEKIINLDELEEEALDGSESAIKALYEYYMSDEHRDPDKAAYWLSFSRETQTLTVPQTPAEPEESPATYSQEEQWLQDYENEVTDKMMLRDLREQVQAGNPFAAIVMGEIYTDETESGKLEKLGLYETARKLLERNAHVPGYAEYLYRLLCAKGIIHRNLSKNSMDEQAKQAFQCFVNAAELADAEDDMGSYLQLAECYEKGFGTPADPQRAKQVLDHWKEMNGVHGLLTLAAERQEENNRLEAIDYLQRCLNEEDEKDPDLKELARYKLGLMGLPDETGRIPDIETVKYSLAEQWAPGLEEFFVPEEEQVFVRSLSTEESISKLVSMKNADILMYIADKLDESRVFKFVDYQGLLEGICAEITDNQGNFNYRFLDLRWEAGDLVNHLDRDNSESVDIAGTAIYDTLFRLFKRADELGNAQGTCGVGWMYASNYIHTDDPTLAGEYFLKAAKMGNPAALVELGVSCVDFDMFDEAVEYMEKAVECSTDNLNRSVALYNTAMLYRASNYSGMNVNHAIELYEEAISLGNKLAAYQLGKMIARSDGSHFPRDLDKAREYLELADQAKVAGAARELGDLYFLGYGQTPDYAKAEQYYLRTLDEAPENTEILVRLGDIRDRMNDYANAFEYFRKAAELGDPVGMYMLGTYYRYGKGVAQNYRMAVEYLGQASDMDYTNATNDLALMYENGEGLPKDEKTAYILFQDAASKNNMYAYWNLARFSRNGIHVNQDPQKAVEYYEKAMELGNASAGNEIGNMYMNGEGMPADPEKAMQWYIRAAKQGSIPACRNLADIFRYGKYVPVDIRQAIYYLQKAAELGDGDAANDIGFIYDRGENIPRNYGKAVEWFRRAANLGEPMAMRNIGRYYELGLGVPRDLTIARNWYEKAVQAGNMEAAYFLSGMYMEGRGVPVNLSEGLRLLKLAAGNGVPDAMNDYGVCFITGKGVPVNVQNAVYWYTKAADAGCAMAMKNLGATYFRDNRVQQDLDAALHYFELATQNGLDCTAEIDQVRAQISQQPRKKDFLSWLK
ncbi:MAG: SEL1-like repeat protein [Solobacterium sp.]|nr:SEL1-like repeat protein [Solobacterium sp.]